MQAVLGVSGLTTMEEVVVVFESRTSRDACRSGRERGRGRGASGVGPSLGEGVIRLPLLVAALLDWTNLVEPATTDREIELVAGL